MSRYVITQEFIRNSVAYVMDDNGNLTDEVIAEYEDFENEYYAVWEYKDGYYIIVDSFNDYDKAKTLKNKLEKGVKYEQY